MRRRSALVAAEILTELERQHLTPEQLSAMTGIEVSVLDSRLLGDERFDVEQLDAIAHALKVTVGALMGSRQRRHGGS